MFSRECLEGLSYRVRPSNGRWRLTDRDLASLSKDIRCRRYRERSHKRPKTSSWVHLGSPLLYASGTGMSRGCRRIRTRLMAFVRSSRASKTWGKSQRECRRLRVLPPAKRRHSPLTCVPLLRSRVGRAKTSAPCPDLRRTPPLLRYVGSTLASPPTSPTRANLQSAPKSFTEIGPATESGRPIGGERRDSNPRSPGPQPGALDHLATLTTLPYYIRFTEIQQSRQDPSGIL